MAKTQDARVYSGTFRLVTPQTANRTFGSASAATHRLIEQVRYWRSVSGLSSPVDVLTVPIKQGLVAAFRLVFDAMNSLERLGADLSADAGVTFRCF